MKLLSCLENRIPPTFWAWKVLEHMELKYSLSLYVETRCALEQKDPFSELVLEIVGAGSPQ